MDITIAMTVPHEAQVPVKEFRINAITVPNFSEYTGRRIARKKEHLVVLASIRIIVRVLAERDSFKATAIQFIEPGENFPGQGLVAMNAAGNLRAFCILRRISFVVAEPGTVATPTGNTQQDLICN
jgi:hypothetical protein